MTTKLRASGLMRCGYEHGTSFPMGMLNQSDFVWPQVLYYFTDVNVVIEIQISNRQTMELDEHLLHEAVERVLVGERITAATVSLALVDDATIRELNQRYLAHDYATDVLSFLLDEEETPWEGEVIVSVETAARNSARYGLPLMQELLLYVIHGTLHLTGHEDADESGRARMRGCEASYLAELGFDHSSHNVDASPALEEISSDEVD